MPNVSKVKDMIENDAHTINGVYTFATQPVLSGVDIEFPDDQDVQLGTDSDGLLRWSTADASNHAVALGLGDSNQALHVTDKAAIATDWNVSADTHPTVYLHSNTTPATDYLLIGGHDGTTANMDVVGGTTLSLKIAGTENAEVNASGLQVNDDKLVDFGTGNDARLLWSTGDADNHALVIGVGDSSQALHITDKGAQATDWNVAAGTHTTLYLHSNTTPATDYTAYGPHDGSDAVVFNVVGATGARFNIDGVGALELDDAAITSFAGATDTAGKPVYVETQDGGAASADTSGVSGGLLSIKGGDGSAGGAHTSNNPNGGNGSTITLTPGSGGAAGAGGSGVAGDPGAVKIGAGMFHWAAAQTIDMADAQVVLTLNPGTPAGTTMTSNILRVDANSGATENLLLPPEADWIGMVVIVNTGGESIVVQNDAGSNVDTVATGEFGMFFCDGTTVSGMNKA